MVRIKVRVNFSISITLNQVSVRTSDLIARTHGPDIWTLTSWKSLQIHKHRKRLHTPTVIYYLYSTTSTPLVLTY